MSEIFKAEHMDSKFSTCSLRDRKATSSQRQNLPNKQHKSSISSPLKGGCLIVSQDEQVFLTTSQDGNGDKHK